MQQHRSTSVFVAVVLLLGLTGYSADSAKSAPETSAPALIAQAEEGKDQPPSGEVEERAVPRMMPGKGMTPGPGIAPKPMVPAAPPVSLPCTGGGGILPGEYAIGTYRGNYLTAVNGGGLITEPVVRTDAQRAGPFEKFKLFVLPSSDPTGQWFIQTANKNCITAVDGGGRTSQVVHTDATKAQAWEFFRFYFDPALGWHGIQTVNLHYVTALGGGGHADPPAVHTDAVKVDNWERFRVWKCGDLGSNLHYSIWVPYNGTLLQAVGGGGRTFDALHAYEAAQSNWGIFTLIKQADASYAIQTANGNYLTATGGGGVTSGSTTDDNIQTNRTQVLDWEKFRFVDQGDCTYAIQTVSGWYLGFPPSQTFPGPRAQFTTKSDIGHALKFKLIAADIR
jgi:hypothetical protein